MVSKYLSSVLYTQPLDPRDDIMLSFLYSAPGNTSGDLLLLQGSEYNEAGLENEDNNGGLLTLNFTNEDSQFDGLGIFLIDGSVPTFTGGGAGAKSGSFNALDPGIGMVTDTNTTAQSAISGIILAMAIDESGAFGKQGSLEQFTTGTVAREPGNIAARTFNADDSTFPLIGSAKPAEPTVVEEVYNIFRVGFKRRLQDLVVYTRDGNIYVPDIAFNTDIPLDTLPESVRIGFSYTGRQPINLKNITINGTTDFTPSAIGPLQPSGNVTPVQPDLNYYINQINNQYMTISEDGSRLRQIGAPPILDESTSTYTLVRSTAIASEGQSFTITLLTTNVADETAVPYTITGIQPEDINENLTGNFIVNNNTATAAFSVIDDGLTENIETFTLTLDNGETNVNVALNDPGTLEETFLYINNDFFN